MYYFISKAAQAAVKKVLGVGIVNAIVENDF